MTETDIVAQEAPPEEVEEQTGPETVNCRHCGQPNEVDTAATPDWQCPACERYQDSMTCPTCNQITRISLVAPELAPEVHVPTKRRRTREGS